MENLTEVETIKLGMNNTDDINVIVVNKVDNEDATQNDANHTNKESNKKDIKDVSPNNRYHTQKQTDKKDNKDVTPNNRDNAKKQTKPWCRLNKPKR